MPCWDVVKEFAGHVYGSSRGFLLLTALALLLALAADLATTGPDPIFQAIIARILEVLVLCFETWLLLQSLWRGGRHATDRAAACDHPIGRTVALSAILVLLLGVAFGLSWAVHWVGHHVPSPFFVPVMTFCERCLLAVDAVLFIRYVWITGVATANTSKDV